MYPTLLCTYPTTNQAGHIYSSIVRLMARFMLISVVFRWLYIYVMYGRTCFRCTPLRTSWNNWTSHATRLHPNCTWKYITKSLITCIMTYHIIQPAYLYIYICMYRVNEWQHVFTHGCPWLGIGYAAVLDIDAILISFSVITRIARCTAYIWSNTPVPWYIYRPDGQNVSGSHYPVL